jgi:hypothetical protein
MDEGRSMREMETIPAGSLNVRCTVTIQVVRLKAVRG